MQPIKPIKPMKPMQEARRWWPDDLGHPSTSGAQDGLRYAFFPDRQRLLVERRGKLTTYDSGTHTINGVAQQADLEQSVTFSGQDGPVNLDDLKQVSGS